MKFLIMLLIPVGCLDLGFARSLSFKASTVTTPAFDAQRVLRDNLINKLPPAQGKIIFRLLANPLVPIDRDEFRETVTTKQGYEHLISIRLPSHGLYKESSTFGLGNIWKVNLHEVMPHTATLTDEDFIVSEPTYEIGQAGLAVLNLVAAGYEDVIEVFKNSDHTQIRDIFLRTFKNLHLTHGKENLAQRFSKELPARKSHLQDARRYLESPTLLRGTTKEELASVLEIPRLEEVITAMENIASIEMLADSQDAMKMLIGKADAIAAFQANVSLQGYDKHVEEISSDADEYMEKIRKTDNRVKLAAIADLGVYGWRVFYWLYHYSESYDNFFEFLAREVKTVKASP